MRTLLRTMGAKMRQIDLQDVCLAVGFAAVCYGLYLAFSPAAYVIGGGLLITYALLAIR